MRELSFEQAGVASGGVPLFVVIALYGEVAAFSAIITGIAAHRTLTN